MENGNLGGGGNQTPPPSSSGVSAASVVRVPFWLRIVPYFMSALLFMSAFFAIFAPLPLILLGLRVRPWFLIAAVATNSALIMLAAGPLSLLMFWIFVVSVVITMEMGISRGWSLEKTGVISLAGILGTALGIVLVYSAVMRLAPWAVLQQELLAFQEMLRQTIVLGPQELQTSLLNGVSVEEWLEGVAYEFPAAIGVFSLIVVSMNLVVLFRMNPQGFRVRLGLDATYLRRWKTPEWLIWPTLLLGFTVLFAKGGLAALALSFFKVFLAVYALQGLSIIGFFLDIWGIRGIFRTLALLVAIFLMLPLILSLGFFDLWFDFRAKFRQT